MLLGCSELPSERYAPTRSGPAWQEEEYYQSEAEGLLECHKCRYLCTGRGEPWGTPSDHLYWEWLEVRQDGDWRGVSWCIESSSFPLGFVFLVSCVHGVLAQKKKNTGRPELGTEAPQAYLMCLALSMGQPHFRLSVPWWDLVLSVCCELPVVDRGPSGTAC